MALFIWFFLLVHNLAANPCTTPRSSIQNFLEQLQHDNWNPQMAATCFEGSADPTTAEASTQAAVQLKQVLDATGMFLNLEDFSDDPSFIDPYSQNSSVAIYSTLPNIIVQKKNDQWIFPKTTFPAISRIYKETFSSQFSQYINTLPPFFKKTVLLGIEVWQIAYFLLLLGFSLLAARILDTVLINQIIELSKKNSLELTSQKLTLIRKPIFWICFGLILMYGAPDLKLSVTLSRSIFWICKFIVTLSLVLLLSRLLNSFADILLKRASKTESKLDDQLIPLLRKTSQVLLWTLGCVFLLQNYGVDVTSLLTLGSLATVGIALASKDAIENLFGSIVAFVDQPFQIGDWVIIDNSIEGIVEEVGFRSTRIRSFTNSLITVPNAKITSCTIDNFGMRKMRRFKCMIGLRYDTPVEKMEEFLAEIRKALENHPTIVKEAIFVYFNQMGAYSLDIMVYTFFHVPDWRAELAEKELLFLEFMRVAQRVGVGFAFPTQTIEVEQFPQPQGPTPPML